MIDFATQVRKNRVLDPPHREEDKQLDSVVSSKDDNTKSDLSDMARRIVSSSPAACVALAFVFGGILGWLTSRR